MVYLNVLIGFSFIMLLFAIGVSIAQTLLTRLLSLKGKAVLEPLLGALEKQWAQSSLPERAFEHVRDALKTQLTTRRGKHAGTLHASSVGNQQVTAGILRELGKELPGLLIGETSDENLGEIWESMVQGIEQDWDAIAPMVSASYTANTKQYMLGLSAAVVLLFNVDAIRIVRILAVDPGVRSALTTDAARAVAAPPASTSGAASTPDAVTAGDTLTRLTSWQKQDVAELKSTGLPLGWELAPLWVCQGGATATYHQPCSGEVSPWDTALMWLLCVLGLLLGIGLVSQGAPFWFSLLQTELGIKRAAAGQPAPVPRSPTPVPDSGTPVSPAQPAPGPTTDPASAPAVQSLPRPYLR